VLSIRGSSAIKPEGDFDLADRPDGESNLAWIDRQLKELRVPRAPATFVLLLGGTSIYDFRLQVAQSQLRHDMTPSHWSHAAIISTVSRSIGQSRLLETSLEPAEGFNLPSMYNGIQGARLSRYGDPAYYPNIALIRIPVDPKSWRGEIEGQKSILDQFREQRVVVDVPTLILEWLAFVWGAGKEGNPLLRGYGIPSAAVIESLLGASGYDICPGLDSSASSPEAIWQTAKWWQHYYTAMNLSPMATRYFVADEGEPESSTSGSPRRTAKNAAPRVAGNPRVPPPPRFLAGAKMTEQLFRRRES